MLHTFFLKATRQYFDTPLIFYLFCCFLRHNKQDTDDWYVCAARNFTHKTHTDNCKVNRNSIPKQMKFYVGRQRYAYL